MCVVVVVIITHRFCRVNAFSVYAQHSQSIQTVKVQCIVKIQHEWGRMQVDIC